MCSGTSAVVSSCSHSRGPHVLTLGGVYLSNLERNCCLYLENVAGRILHIPEERDDAGAALGGDQLPEDQGDATVNERW